MIFNRTLIYAIIRYIISGFKYRKTRTFLTLLGVIIGIFAIVSLITLGQGMKQGITLQFEKIGTDKIMVLPGGNLMQSMSAVGGFTKKELDEIKKVNGVKEVSYYIMRIADVNFNHKTKYLYVSGLPQDQSKHIIEDMQNYKIEYGRDLGPNDNYKVVVGNLFVTKKLFGKPIRLGDKITISGKRFKVVGILARIGNEMDDSSLIIPAKIAKQLFGTDDKIDFMFVQVYDKTDIYNVVDRIKEKLRKIRHKKPGGEDFSVKTTDDLIKSFNKILNIVNIVLISIAMISLIVGAIGIMNTTFTSVLERRKEIAIMKAVGAKKEIIIIIFLIESGLIALFGGIMGVTLGYAVSNVVGRILNTHMPTLNLFIKVNPVLVIFALLFSFFIGVISGIAPAWEASKLKPAQRFY